MDINSILILDNLKKKFKVSCFGKRIDEPLLRPLFYSAGSKVEKNRIYIAHPDALPPKEQLGDNVLLICVEGRPSLSYQCGDIPLFIIENEATMIVFNEVLAIFERYDIWEKSLEGVMAMNADISELVQCTFPLLMNDITVIDENLHILAAVFIQLEEDGESVIVKHIEHSEIMPAHTSKMFQAIYKENKNKRNPFFSIEDSYCINLYVDDKYTGNVSLVPRLEKLSSSDIYILDILASYVLEAIKIHNKNSTQEMDIQKQTVMHLLEGLSFENCKFGLYGTTDPSIVLDRYFCFCINILDDLKRFSADYICDILSKRFSDCVIIKYNESIVGILDVQTLPYDYTRVLQLLEEDLRELDLHAGISDRFCSFGKVRYSYMQARYALEFGETADGNKYLHFFQDHALRYLMLHSTGDFPTEFICHRGLLALRKYDENSTVDYWNTLRCYLDEQMNIAQTAKILCIHRNTLIQRIERIVSITELDLEDPMTRLWVRISLYLFDAENISDKSKTRTWFAAQPAEP